jgi:hypothetical protein
LDPPDSKSKLRGGLRSRNFFTNGRCRRVLLSCQPSKTPILCRIAKTNRGFFNPKNTQTPGGGGIAGVAKGGEGPAASAAIS